jgi:hypothetical protein
MIIGRILRLFLICFMATWLFTNEDAWGNPSGNGDPTQEELVAFARCLTEKGWVMYGSFTCSACRAQRKAFGKAFSHIEEIECNPHAPNTQVDLCLEKKIGKTPTWILEKNEKETKRIEGYQLLENLAPKSGCEL